MLNWHSSMSDPIYAVGSYYVDNRAYPDADIVSQAVLNLSIDLNQHQRMLLGDVVMVKRGCRMVDLKVFAGYTQEQLSDNIADLKEIILHLGQNLTQDYHAT